MKSHLLYKKILLCLSAGVFINSYAQQENPLTTTPANINSSSVLIDLPGLTGKPDAIIIATPLGNTKTMNPHPVGGWYYNGKRDVFNSDQKGAAYWDIANNSVLLLPGSHLLTLPAGTNKIDLKSFATGPKITFGHVATPSTMIVQIIPQ